MRYAASVLCSLAFVSQLMAQSPKQVVTKLVDDRQRDFTTIAHQIWTLAEVGYQEEKSSALLQAELRKAGFKVESGVAGIPTAFVATWGSGKPVVGMMAEYDALPGLSQEVSPERKPIIAGAPGHGCGHHLLGSASTLAAIAVKDWLQKSGQAGTIKLFGTPAEEGGSGKVYMVRAGLFNDVDVVLAYHPSDINSASPETNLANKSAKFRFRGLSAHAAGAPEKGRSALDGVEAMNYMVNMLREHVPQTTRIHYVITNGGKAPNVVPDFAEVYYYVRHPDGEEVKRIFDRVVEASKGAALGTGTSVDHEIIGGTYAMLPNESLARLLYANLQSVGGVRYDASEQKLADQIAATLQAPEFPMGSQEKVQPFVYKLSSGSTDAGDVSWNVPLAEISTATWVPGTPAHSWQAVVAGGMTIGEKGMLNAARTLAITAVDLYLDPAKVAAAKQEFLKNRPAGFRYTPMLGDRPPALDYRKTSQ
jgi:aminobenzoyl-glutamate utilization protein B